MKILSGSALVVFLSMALAMGHARLVYHHAGTIHPVDGFDFTRPYYEKASEKHYLPIEGKWGLEVQSESFWDHCYFPITYQVRQVNAPSVDGDLENQFGIVFGDEPFPVGDANTKDLASYWLPGDFQASLVFLGWSFEGQVVEADVVRTDNPIDRWLINEAFSGFRIRADHLEGFPFFFVLGQDDLKTRVTQKNFTAKNSDYLYRLACVGSVEDFEALEIAPKDLRRVYTANDLTLMHGASLYGNIPMLEYLFSVEADRVKFKGLSPIMRYAVIGGKEKSVMLLAKQGHSAIQKSKLSYNPYEEAIRLGLTRVVDVLTKDKKYLRYKGKHGNAATMALIAGKQGVFNLLMEKAEDSAIELKVEVPDYQRRNLQTLFHDSCLLGQLDLAAELIQHGVDLMEPTKGYTPLAAAVRSGNAKLVELLIEKGASLETMVGKSGESLLHLAAKFGFSDVIRLLAKNGVDVNAVDSRGVTPLYLAVLSKKVSSVHELLGSGADPNLRPSKRPAAVWMAVVQDERESVQSLIDFGATCELDTTLAMQLMEYALAFDIPEVVSISLEQCLTPDFSFRGAVPGIWLADYYDAESSKKVLVDGGADLEKRPNWAFSDSPQVLSKLMESANFSIQYPKRLREIYGDLKVRVEVIIDPIGNVRFPKFLEELPWELRLFLRESIRSWSVDLPQDDELNTAYRVVIPLELKSEEYGVKVFEVSDVEKAPVPLVRVPPVYPPELRTERIQGKVTVVFIVDEKGEVRRPSIESSTNRYFNESAMNAVRQWRFAPGYLDGRPVPTRLRLPLSFTLR